MRRIAIVTGTRAEYGILKPVIQKVVNSETLKPYVLATGMHLSPEFGLTVQQIEEDGFPLAAKIDMLFSSDTMPAMGKGVGIGIYGLTQELERMRAHCVIVLGDRVEAFAGATAGLFCGAVVAHIHGGDVTQGGLDEYMRHAITKMSHVHFAATEKSKERILKLGENPEYVYQVGTPGLDDVLQFAEFTDQELSDELDISIPSRFALVVQHPISTNPDAAADEISETLTALKYSGVHTILVYPNADAGSREMISVIRGMETEPWLDTFVSLSREVFCNLLRKAAVLVGNSSAGMIDAPAFGVPVINIGVRQEGRERGENVLDTTPNRNDIERALNRVLTDQNFLAKARHTINPYGDGKASERIINILETMNLSKARKSKRLTF